MREIFKGDGCVVAKDLIMNAGHEPTYNEIVNYIDEPGKEMWQDINIFIQDKFKSSPRIAFSKCSGKPGWNVKYQKSGKSVCTLYPEKDGFVILIVVTKELATIIESMNSEFDLKIMQLIKSTKLFNNTLWLMIQVDSEAIEKDVKRLLLLKHNIGQSV